MVAVLIPSPIINVCVPVNNQLPLVPIWILLAADELTNGGSTMVIVPALYWLKVLDDQNECPVAEAAAV